MQRLSGTDALFVAMETPAWHQHVGGVVVLDPRDARRFGGFEAVRANIEARLAWVPKYRWKLREVPLRLDRPVWVKDRGFDIDRHVHRVTAPPPGGPRELGDLAGRLMSEPLDRNIPLWQFWYVDGIAGGLVAIVAKYHHSLMDGLAGVSLATVMFDLEPEPPLAADRPLPPSEPTGPEPSEVELLVRSVVPAMTLPVRAARYGLKMARRMVTMSAYRSGRDAPPITSPSTPFNGAVGPRRSLAFASVSLDDVKRVKKALDVKVNDVLLAMCAGAVRDYLRSVDALPDAPLVAAVPVSTAGSGDADDGYINQVANMWVPLPTDTADPIARVERIVAGTTKAKAMMQAMRTHPVPSAGEVVPLVVLGLASRAVSASGLAGFVPVMGGNLVLSNLPGPPVALYTCGAKVAGIYSASVLAFNIGMNITLMSYEDRIDFGVTVDPDLLDDPWQIADRLPDALGELMHAADLGEPSPVADPFAS